MEMDALLNLSSATFFEIYLLANVLLLALLPASLPAPPATQTLHSPLIVIGASEVRYICWMYSTGVDLFGRWSEPTRGLSRGFVDKDILGCVDNGNIL